MVNVCSVSGGKDKYGKASLLLVDPAARGCGLGVDLSMNAFNLRAMWLP